MSDLLQGSSILLHGPAKSGKTTIATSFPDPMFIATESGHKYIPAAQRKKMLRLSYEETQMKGGKIFSNGWAKLLWFLEEEYLAKNKPKTVPVDTIGPLYQMCMDWVCTNKGIEHPDEQAHGRGWAAVKKEFIKGLGILASQCEKINATLLFISHTKQEELRAGSRTYHKLMSDLPGQARSVIVPAVDHIWYLGFKDNADEDSLLAFEKNRTLWIQPTSVVEAGSRDENGLFNGVTMISPLAKTDQFDQIVKTILKKGK